MIDMGLTPTVNGSFSVCNQRCTTPTRNGTIINEMGSLRRLMEKIKRFLIESLALNLVGGVFSFFPPFFVNLLRKCPVLVGTGSTSLSGKFLSPFN